MMGCDVASVDEWDLFGCKGTCETYAKWISAIDRNTSFVAANLDYSRNPFLNQTRLAPWDVKIRGGRKVGFVGFAQIDIAKKVGDSLPASISAVYGSAWTDQENENEWLGDPMAFALQELQEAHPDCNIICFVGSELTSDHDGWARKMFLSYPDLDIIISIEDSVMGKTILTRNNAHASFIHVPEAMSASKYTSGAMAVASFGFDSAGKLLAVEQTALSLDDGYDADPEIWAYVSSIYQNATEAYQEVISNATITVSGDSGTVASSSSSDDSTARTVVVPGCRLSDCPMGRITNMANMAQCDSCNFAMMNGGAFRSSISTGDVTLQDLKSATPFDNYLTTVELTGSSIRTLLEHAVTLSPNWQLCSNVKPTQCSDNCNAEACDDDGGYPQFLGLRWSYNILSGSVLSVDIYDRITRHWYSLEDDRTYKCITSDYLVGGGDGYDMFADLGSEIMQLPIAQFDALEGMLRQSTTNIFQGMSAPFALSEQTLALFEQSSTDAYRACDVKSPLGVSNGSLPMRQTICTALSVSATSGDYDEPPYDVGIAVIVNSQFELSAVESALSAINADSSVLPYTELCTWITMVDDVADDVTSWLAIASSNVASCASGRVPASTGVVAGVLAPTSIEAANAANVYGIPVVLFDTAETWLLSSTNYPFTLVASPNNDDFAQALGALLAHYSWPSALLVYTSEYADLATHFGSVTLAHVAACSVVDGSSFESGVGLAMSEHPNERVVLLLASAADTQAALLAVSALGLETGYAYITLSNSGSLAMDGVLVLCKPFNVSDYVSDALWAAAHGISGLIESGMSRSLPDDSSVQDALADVLLVHSSIAANSFTSAATGDQVAFDPSGRLESQQLTFLSVRDGITVTVGNWLRGGLSLTIESWPGSQTSPPTIGCSAGFGFDTRSLKCVACGVGTFNSDAGARTSCEPCPLGTFAPQAGSGVCGLCANGEVSLQRGSDRCETCPSGATCKNTSSLLVNYGMWRPDGHPYEILECPVPEACPGNSRGFGEELCATGRSMFRLPKASSTNDTAVSSVNLLLRLGFVGPLCLQCDGDRFWSWLRKTCEKVRASTHTV